jgi:hypothetical protein
MGSRTTAQKESKAFFFGKKKQKTFFSAVAEWVVTVRVYAMSAERRSDTRC